VITIYFLVQFLCYLPLHVGREGKEDLGYIGDNTEDNISTKNPNDYEKLLQNCDCLLPVKRNYYIETVRSQYEHAHNKRDLDECEKIIIEKYPEYSNAFTQVMQQWKSVLTLQITTSMKQESMDS
jgi:hypothetical protein